MNRNIEIRKKGESKQPNITYRVSLSECYNFSINVYMEGGNIIQTHPSRGDGHKFNQQLTIDCEEDNLCLIFTAVLYQILQFSRVVSEVKLLDGGSFVVKCHQRSLCRIECHYIIIDGVKIFRWTAMEVVAQ